MKKTVQVMVLSLVVGLMLASTASAVTRMVLAEMFTNTG